MRTRVPARHRPSGGTRQEQDKLPRFPSAVAKTVSGSHRSDVARRWQVFMLWWPVVGAWPRGSSFWGESRRWLRLVRSGFADRRIDRTKGSTGQRGCVVTEPFRGVVNLDIRDSVPDWAPYEQPKAPPGTPNVVYIVLDDVGFGALSCYGGMVDTPNIDRVAAGGVRYNQWHTTALCSPTRSCLLTGRNHTTNGMACITEAAAGFPNGNGHIPPQCATLAEMLVERGFSTAAVGKWHLTAEDEMNLASTRRNWPLGRGFDRFYGFLGAETNQWYPDLVHDNHPIDPPFTPEQGYHLTVDITDKSIQFVDDVKAIAPDRPVFLYYAPGAAHAPHHVPKEWAESTGGGSTRGTSGSGRSSWPGRRNWVSCRRTRSCRRSTRSAPTWTVRGPTTRRSPRWITPNPGTA